MDFVRQPESLSVAPGPNRNPLDEADVGSCTQYPLDARILDARILGIPDSSVRCRSLMAKKRLLFLTPRLPYPPNKGDKISTFNMLKFFSSRHDVYLGAFVDDPADLPYRDMVAARCAKSLFVPISPKIRTLLSLRGLLTGSPLSVTFYGDRKMQNWVDTILREERPDAVLIYSSVMGRFLIGRDLSKLRFAFNLEDIDSQKWRQYGVERPFPLSWIYSRESRHLLTFERQLAKMANVTILISADEADLFKTLAPESASSVTNRVQGVDSAFFDPSIPFASPYAEGAKVLAFVGAMNYRPNIDGAVWYANEMFPRVRAKEPNAEFWIVGMSPTDEVKALTKIEGVHVTGSVEDVRPYVRHAVAACLPLRLARGIQNKALEAMAMEKPLITTPEALTGIFSYEGFRPMIASTPDEFVAASLEVLSAPPRSDHAARKCILENYNWDANLHRLNEIMFAS